MNLQQLQAELKRLGITFQSDSDPANIATDLRLQRQYRASIYLAELQAAWTDFWTNFNAPPPGGVGLAAYDFAKYALKSGELLNSLALALDYWVCPAVEGQIQINNYTSLADYQNYFNTNILNANYAANVLAFRNNYPITDNALVRIAANFRANIKEACGRAFADRAAIQNLFIDLYPGLTLTSLKAIKSTGSDFHKGGKQVLVLTFGTFWWWGRIPWWSDLKVVYKPTDLEIDCLLVGNSNAVNAATAPAQFMVNSLVEIFNNRAAANPPANFEPLPAYRILPRSPTSNMPIGPAGLPIRAAYGYMEYLGYDLTGIPIPYSNYYLTGESDYLIYHTQDETQIVPRFYRQTGEWLALATMFAITDMHMENVRVTKYQPRLIDLEISLTKVFNFDVTETTMFKVTMGTTLGGINGETNGQAEFLRQVRLNGGFLQIGRVPLPKKFQNRLWAMRPSERVVPVNSFLLLQGLRNAMDVIRAGQQNGDFTAWFNRLTNTNVLVRVLPYGTTTWETVRRNVYETAVENAPGAALRQTIMQNMQLQINMDFPHYVPPGLPTFVAMVPGTPVAPSPAVVDLEHFDIPAFYHRIGTTDILDSAGHVLAVPPQVTVNGVLVNTVALVGRNTYFAASPTTANVNVAQVQAIGNMAQVAFDNQVQQMEQGTVGPNGLNTNVVPGVMGALIP